MPKKKVPVGVDNFYKMVKGDYLFCDKTMMIAEFFERGEEVTLLTRQRRSGKTLNMSMLQHFLAPKVSGVLTQGLFDGLKVANIDGGRFVEENQGKHPVIFITLKDVNEPSFEEALQKIGRLIMKLYGHFENIER